MAKKKMKRIVKVTRKKKKKKHLARRVILMLLFIVLAVIGLEGYQIGSSLMSGLNGMDRVEIGDTDKDLMINDGVSASTADRVMAISANSATETSTIISEKSTSLA